MSHVVVWPGVNVRPVGTDKDIVVYRGNLLPEGVDAHTLFVLTTTGAVRSLAEGAAVPGDLAAPQIPTLKPEQSAVVVAGVTGVPLADVLQQQAEVPSDAGNLAAGLEGGEDAVDSSAKPVKSVKSGRRGTRPADQAPKGEWVEYAVLNGEERPKAEAMTKTDLVRQLG